MSQIIEAQPGSHVVVRGIVIHHEVYLPGDGRYGPLARHFVDEPVLREIEVDGTEGQEAPVEGPIIDFSPPAPWWRDPLSSVLNSLIPKSSH